MLWKADFDKPHRCPVCWRVPDGFWEHGMGGRDRWRYSKGQARFFAIYTCPNGHRFTRLPIPGRRDTDFGSGMTIRDEIDRLTRRFL